ncbi:recombination hotspot-binding protein-like protein [Zopfia rhizophila CBS 207.26]|uniref:Recombination hotspot-binding protein-like protein n=1 Tax=Zopfia rhizophila CBS 207.26 TaxID=1314779 RepID=A0A6A6EGM1_9PEZI|nr:recombination hotspot-binding protein-like protein [Zopfia rhizophila CBS 207.26]
MATQSAMIDPAIFQALQERADEDTAVRDELKDIVQTLEKQNRNVQFVLSRAQSTPVDESEIPSALIRVWILTMVAVSAVLDSAESPIKQAVEIISKLAGAASKLPYYKYNNMWSRQVQETAYGILLWGWLGRFKQQDGEIQFGRLLTIEDVGEVMNVPVNLKDRDEFHLTIEEYLQAVISLVDELARLARNSVTLGDYERPLVISQFVKDVHAGFQILNLKNDSLRRRSDGLKYRVKDVEDVVYDLSLRNLISKKEERSRYHG